jgi:hypothetical protein
MTTTSSTGRPDRETRGNGEAARPREVAGDVAQGVRDAAGTVAARLPEAAATTRAVVDEAARRIESGSDEMLNAGATLSLGFALGLFVGGANRILVVLALIPAAAMGLTLLDRNGRGGQAARQRQA